MSLYQDQNIATYNGIDYMQIIPTKDNAGIYQAIPTTVRTTYIVTATLIGENHWQSIDNFAHGSSYIAVDSSAPSPSKTPDDVSRKVIGRTPTKIEFTLDALSTTTYISVRGDTAWYYPNVSHISVKELQ